MKKWEYRPVGMTRSMDEFIRKVNELGKDGWELVFVDKIVESTISILYDGVMKREIPA